MALYVKNPHYWLKGLPYLDGVQAVILNSDNAVTALLGGSIEMDSNPAALPLVRNNPGIKILTVRGQRPLMASSCAPTRSRSAISASAKLMAL